MPLPALYCAIAFFRSLYSEHRRIAEAAFTYNRYAENWGTDRRLSTLPKEGKKRAAEIVSRLRSARNAIAHLYKKKPQGSGRGGQEAPMNLLEVLSLELTTGDEVAILKDFSELKAQGEEISVWVRAAYRAGAFIGP